jgi:hypothetical protein
MNRPVICGIKISILLRKKQLKFSIITLVCVSYFGISSLNSLYFDYRLIAWSLNKKVSLVILFILKKRLGVYSDLSPKCSLINHSDFSNTLPHKVSVL